MDRKVLIKKLKNVFCEINKTGKKYSEVWSSEVNFGGLYRSGQYNLNVRAEHQISNLFEEIREIIQLLDEKAYEESQFIWSVHVYNADDRLHCVEDGILVYDEEDTCK